MPKTGVHRPYAVAAVRPEGAAGVTLILDAPLPAQPGQFVMAWLPGIEERPLCLMDDVPAALTIAEVGPFTEACCHLGVGDRIWLRGPYGHGFGLVGERPLLLAGGCGAAALALLAKRFRAQGTEVTVIVGARSSGGLMLAWRYQELGCLRPGAHAPGRRPRGPHHGHARLGQPGTHHEMRHRRLWKLPLRRPAGLHRWPRLSQRNVSGDFSLEPRNHP